jgi:beta-glucosidase
MEPVATLKVTNTGGVAGDEVVQLYVKTPGATVPAPRIRLADFKRVHIPKGGKATVSLLLTPKYHAVVHDEGKTAFWTPTMSVEEGMIALFVGGGQPDFTKGVQSSTVLVKNAANLTTQYTC